MTDIPAVFFFFGSSITFCIHPSTSSSWLPLALRRGVIHIHILPVATLILDSRSERGCSDAGCGFPESTLFSMSPKYVKVCLVRHKSFFFGGFWTVSVFSFIMAGRLLFVFLMYYFHKIQTQALLLPKLTVNPSTITETDSVTLNCQTPPSVSVSQCFFYTLNGGTVRIFSCLRTLTGSELLFMGQHRSPALVKVKCYYTVKTGDFDSPSPHSDSASITVVPSLPPKLTVSPSMVTETDSVTLNCQTPPSVSVSQCFYTLNGGTVRIFSCVKTLTGTELLKMSHQSSPAEVKVKCYYTVTTGVVSSQSPESDVSSITIHSSPPPKLTVNPSMITETETVTLNCQTPPSVSVSECYFYTGGGKHIQRREQRFSCLKTLTGTELLEISHQSSPVEVKVTCFYINTYRSPESDVSSIIIQRLKTGSSTSASPTAVKPTSDIAEKELSVTQTKSTLIMTTGLTVSTLVTSAKQTPDKKTTDSGRPVVTPSKTGSPTSVSPSAVKPTSDINGTPVNPTSGSETEWILKFAAVVAGCGVTVGIISLGSALLCTKTTGCGKVKKQRPQNDNYDIYHMYDTIADKPAAPALLDLMYSTVQMH